MKLKSEFVKRIKEYSRSFSHSFFATNDKIKEKKRSETTMYGYGMYGF